MKPQVNVVVMTHSLCVSSVLWMDSTSGNMGLGRGGGRIHANRIHSLFSISYTHVVSCLLLYVLKAMQWVSSLHLFGRIH